MACACRDERANTEFHSTLEKVYDELISHDIKLVLGDSNTIVRLQETYAGMTGRISLYEINNDNGQLLVDFTSKNNLVIHLKCFPP